MVDKLSTFPLNVNQDTTQKPTYRKGIVSEINDTKEIIEDNFPINLNISTNINGKTPEYWLNINMVCTKEVLFVEEVI